MILGFELFSSGQGQPGLSGITLSTRTIGVSGNHLQNNGFTNFLILEAQVGGTINVTVGEGGNWIEGGDNPLLQGFANEINLRRNYNNHSDFNLR